MAAGILMLLLGVAVMARVVRNDMAGRIVKRNLAGDPVGSASADAGDAGGMGAGAVAPEGRLVLLPDGAAARGGLRVDAGVVDQVERIASEYGVRATSAYRSPANNRAVGGAERSDHLCGLAVDFAGPRAALVALERWARSSGAFAYVDGPDQNTDGNHGDHVHISFGRCP